ncbi:uncharacterized protein LOC142976140 isoform X2 [Anticarsia gemmatalis]|uniref:uncharacterized protein LOC142976140 isoform X2 n=1 Tax=Anticarsia gemmatalis TaxID=129554 RepID=UPI003F76356C
MESTSTPMNDLPSTSSSTTCPACNSALKLFFINMGEKLLMCENLTCAFPFGCTNLQLYKIDPETAHEEIASIRSIISPGSVTSGSTISTNEWSELDKMNKAMADIDEGTYSPVPTLVEQMDDKDVERITKEKEREEVIRKDIERIKELNKKLFQPDEPDSISNNKWLEDIVKMQGNSGVQLLKEHELKRCKKAVPNIGLGELKIDIDTATNAMPKIQIAVTNVTENN